MIEKEYEYNDYWGELLLAMAWDARQYGDLVTAELLLEEAVRYFDEGDRFAERWRKFEKALDDETSRRPREAA
jgi:hypothetical protein